MKYEIILDDSLDQFVAESALADAVDEATWLSRKINGAVKKVMRETAIESISKAEPEDIQAYADAVKTVKADIQLAAEAAKAADVLANPVVEVPSDIKPV